MIHIHIQNIKVHTISTIGSLNIGKAVLCHNRSTCMAVPMSGYEKVPAESDEEQTAIGEIEQPSAVNGESLDKGGGI